MAMTPEYAGNEHDRPFGRPFPHSAEAERGILGSCLLDNGLVGEAAQALRPEDFYVRAHEFVFRAMLTLSERGSEIDPLLLSEELRRDGVLEQAGGMTFISELTYGLPHFTNVAAYAKVVKDFSVMRQLVKVCNKATSEALEGEDDADTVLDRAEEMIFALRSGRGRAGGGPVPYSEVWERFCERQRAKASGKYQPVPFFDLPRLNAMTGGGVYENQLVTVAAVTSRGKSSWLKQMVDYNSAQGVGCIYFSREMEDLAIIGRSIAAETGRDGDASAVPANLVRNAYALDGYRKERVTRAGQRLARRPVWVETLTGNVGEMYRQVRFWLARTWPEWLRRHHAEDWEERRGRFLVVVDYPGLMGGPKGRYNSKAEEMGDVWRFQKDMAQDFRARVVAAAQFSGEGYKGDRPRLSQIEWSKEAVKATNVGIVLWTPEKEFAEAQKAGRTRYPVGIYVDKQTEGPTGHVEAEYDTQTLEFYPPTPFASGAGDFNR